MYKVTFLLYQLLIFLNLFIVHLFRQRLQKRKFLPVGGSRLFLFQPSQWIGNNQLFKVGLILHYLQFFKLYIKVRLSHGACIIKMGL